jgi:hypothetical protein
MVSPANRSQRLLIPALAIALSIGRDDPGLLNKSNNYYSKIEQLGSTISSETAWLQADDFAAAYFNYNLLDLRPTA